MTGTTPYTERRHIRDRRGGWRLGEVIAVVALLLQLAALVWGASALNSSVAALKAGQAGMREAIHALTDATNELKIEVRILQDRERRRSEDEARANSAQPRD